jgi:membrane protein DedA with SNARE-associated domain
VHLLFPAETIHHLIASYGYFGLGLLILLECVGLPLPGEATLIAAAVYAGTTHNLQIWLVVAIAAGAASVGGAAGYWIGRKFGLPLLQRFGPRIGLDQTRVSLGQYLFREHGGKIIFFGRFVAFLRVFAALLAGANNYRQDAFLFYNTTSAIVWASVFGFSSYEFGNIVHKVARPIGIAGFIVAIVGLGLSVFLARRHEHRLMAQAAEAMRKSPAP